MTRDVRVTLAFVNLVFLVTISKHARHRVDSYWQEYLKWHQVATRTGIVYRLTSWSFFFLAQTVSGIQNLHNRKGTIHIFECCNINNSTIKTTFVLSFGFRFTAWLVVESSGTSSFLVAERVMHQRQRVWQVNRNNTNTLELEQRSLWGPIFLDVCPQHLVFYVIVDTLNGERVTRRMFVFAVFNIGDFANELDTLFFMWDPLPPVTGNKQMWNILQMCHPHFSGWTIGKRSFIFRATGYARDFVTVYTFFEIDFFVWYNCSCEVD